MRSGWLGSVLVVAAVVAAGCSEVIPGAATAGPPRVPQTSVEPPAPPTPTAPAGPRSALDADAVPDECLLNAAELGALAGVAVRPPVQGTVPGSAGISCVATAGADPVALINVYRVRTGTPADYVRGGPSGGRHDLTGIGEAATVFDTPSGPTLQLASARYLVTIAVTGRTPTDAAWRTAATAALSRLPS